MMVLIIAYYWQYGLLFLLILYFGINIPYKTNTQQHEKCSKENGYFFVFHGAKLSKETPTP